MNKSILILCTFVIAVYCMCEDIRFDGDVYDLGFLIDVQFRQEYCTSQQSCHNFTYSLCSQNNDFCSGEEYPCSMCRETDKGFKVSLGYYTDAYVEHIPDEKGVYFKYIKGSKRRPPGSATSIYTHTFVKLLCDKLISGIDFTYYKPTITSTDYYYNITLKSKYACPVNHPDDGGDGEDGNDGNDGEDGNDGNDGSTTDEAGTDGGDGDNNGPSVGLIVGILGSTVALIGLGGGYIIYRKRRTGTYSPFGKSYSPINHDDSSKEYY